MLRLIAALLLTGGAHSAHAAEPWSQRARLPEPRQEVAVAGLDGEVYVIGGFRLDVTTADTVEVYDPNTDTWSLAASLPTGLHHTAAATVGGKLYVIGGLAGALFSPVDSVLEYDPVGDSWTSKTPMPTARGALAIAVIAGKIYVAGGSPAARESDFAVYDPASDTWTTLPYMPTPRNHLAAGATAGKFYAVGGRSGGIGGITYALEEYDPNSMLWSAKAPIPTARGGIAGAVFQDRLYVFGGEGNPAGLTRCRNCLSQLRSKVFVTAEKVRELTARKARSRRVWRRIKIGSAAFVLLVVTLLITYNSLDIRLFAPASTSDISSASTPGDSAMFQRNFGRTGYVPVKGWTPRLEVQWTFETDSPFLSSPAVVGNTLYAATGDNRFVALDTNTGGLLWQFSTTGPVDSSPAVAGDLAFVGLRDKRMLAIDRESGRPVWAFTTGGPIYSSPLVKDGFVYFGSTDGKIYALDAKTAAVNWTYQTEAGVASSFSIQDNILVAGSRDRHTYVLNVDTGKHRAIFRSPSGVENAPVISNGRAYVSAGSGAVRAFDVTAREMPFEKALLRLWTQLWVWHMAPAPPLPNSHLWISKFKDKFQGNMALANDRLFLPAFSGIVYALDARTGKSVWRFDTGSIKLRSTPLVVGDTVLIGASNGILYALDAKTGEERWRFHTGGNIQSAPVFANDTLYLTSGDGTLYAIK